MHDNILVIRLSALGDIAMVWPALVAAAMKHPERNYYLLTSPMWEDVARPKNMHVVPYYRHRYSGARGFMRLMAELRKIHPTQIIDLHNVLRSWLIDLAFRLQGVPVSMVSKQRSERKRILHHEAEATPFTQRYAEMLGISVNDDENDDDDDNEDENDNAEASDPALHNSSRSIGIAPFARYTTKTYPLEKMKEVVRLLAERGMQPAPSGEGWEEIYLFGSRGEQAEVLQGWVDELGIGQQAKVVPMMNLTLADELALMSRLNLMLSMDSANGHLAAMMRTPVLTIWGGTTPACGFTPWHSRQNRSLLLNLPCQPCSIAGSKECPLGHMNCLRQISPEQIVNYLSNPS